MSKPGFRFLTFAAGIIVLYALTPLCATGAESTANDKPRVVVTTDPELDDSNSLIRYLLYTTDFRTEGIIYASSQFHWTGDGKTLYSDIPCGPSKTMHLTVPKKSERWAEGESFIDDAVAVYAKAYPNLIIHNRDYPTPAELQSKIRVGNVEFVGDINKDSPGSELIKSLLLDDKPGPLYLLAWAGQSTIARALKSIKDEYESTPQWTAIRDKVSHKAIIQSFGDQDWTNADYITPNWPDIEFRQMSTTIWAYWTRNVVLPQDRMYLDAEWTKQNVSDIGPMGAHYRVWGDGRRMKGDEADYFGYADMTVEQLAANGHDAWASVQPKGSWISEGDSSTFMNLLNNGLRGYQAASFGGWGGRSGIDIGPNGTEKEYASTRFFGAAQRDFAARLKWSATSEYSKANHEPEVSVNDSLDRTARPGQKIILEASAKDPDGDGLTSKWWQYREAGTYNGSVTIDAANSMKAEVTVPADAVPGNTIHLILEVTDDGSPQLTTYRRVIITVK